MIYFAQLPTGAIKIGKADDVGRRIAQLEREFMGPVSVLKTMPGGFEEERAVHLRFNHLRFERPKGEQFRPAQDLMDFIGMPLLVSPNPDTVERAEKLRAVRLELSEEEHAALRIEAAKQDTSLMHLARAAVREYLARRAGSK